MDGSNTAENSRKATGKPFVKGDPRINRKGRPKDFDQLRDLSRDMFSRPAKDANGQPVLIEGRPATIIEVVLWKMIHSKDPREVRYAVEVAYGKVPEAVDVTSKGQPIKISVTVSDNGDV